MLGNNLRLPFETQIFGVTASVESIDVTEDDQLIAFAGRARLGCGSRSRNCRCPRHPQRGPSGWLRTGVWRTGTARQAEYADEKGVWPITESIAYV